MSNINLYQTSGGNAKEQGRLAIMDSGFFWSLSSLLFILVLLGGSKLVTRTLEGKKLALENQITQESASFGGSDLDRIVDFQARVDEANKSIKTKVDMAKVFTAIENSITKGSSAVSLVYTNDGKKTPFVEAKILAGDFPVVAKQILSFKENPSFKDISVEEITRGEEGIDFKVGADFK
ncbi:MAG: hypothetical protein ACD_11C00074G0003 [uncultured bacterium]|nr:MAG: hypothetical protein ACD_11C00074G0003 [uncultured bacterium]